MITSPASGETKMKIIITTELDRNADILCLGLFEEDTSVYQSLSPELAKKLQEKIKDKKFSRKFGESFSTHIASLSYKEVITFGLGRKSEFDLEKLRRILGKAVNYTKAGKFTSFSTNFVKLAGSIGGFDEEKIGRAVAEGLLLANYDYIKYLSAEARDKKKPVDSVSVQWLPSLAIEKGIKVGRMIAECTNLARDLVNEPANVANSIYLENMAKSIAAGKNNVKLKVLNKDELKKEKMGALLAVNAGSDNPPKLLILEYKGAKTGRYTALVGKGITFDSGGYNLKPTRYIEEMKTDMAGGAAVLTVIKAAVELNITKNIVGVVPLCENMISGSSQRPGDIVTAYNGKTIEIGNTDAEGRLILADALAYAEDKYTPEVIIDLATLTGACVVALGYYAAGMICTDELLSSALKKAGESSGDRVWPFPFFEEFQDWMDGDIADLNNISVKGKGYEAGPITGAVFLSKFIEKSKWAHLDIAGSAYWPIEGAYFRKGATGSGVRLLIYYFLDNFKNN